MRELLTPITVLVDKTMVKVKKELEDGTEVVSTASPTFAMGLLEATPYTIIETKDDFDIKVEGSPFSFSTSDFVLKPKPQKKGKTNDSEDKDK